MAILVNNGDADGDTAGTDTDTNTVKRWCDFGRCNPYTSPRGLDCLVDLRQS